MRNRAFAALVPLAFATAAFAQQQQVVKPPIAVYWVSAATTSGLAAGGGGTAAMMGMMLGRGGGSAQRTLDLRLGSSQAASGAPQAQHDIPPGLNMGPSLPLLTPARAPAQPGERDLPGDMGQPKGRLLIFWGCGEKAGPGQPVVVDYAGLAAGQRPPNLAARRVAVPAGPMFGHNRSFGAWPNQQDSRPVPADGSLKGDHAVKANYAPEIRFTVDEQRDFMPGVALTSSATATGARQVRWGSVTGATGYFMTAFGSKEGSGDVVMWSSSAVQEMGGALMDYVPPNEVARLVRERVILPPQTNECTVPVEVLKAAEIPMLQFIAYGDELNVVHPPRPKDPKIAWEQQWAVKVRLKSTSMTPLADGMDMGAGAAEPRARGPREEARTPGAPGEAQQQQGEGSPVGQGVEILRGIFGR
ncbi:MAG: hypothetical protein IT515_03190 [Burkholderiales bacterium]|nr:hypothetical protein [Burkholderiales bacterium]